MQNPGVAVVVTEAEEVRRAITLTLESEGWVVLPLEDGAELFDFVEFISENPLRMGAPRLVVTELDLPGPSIFETIAWARVCGPSCPSCCWRRTTTTTRRSAPARWAPSR